MHYLKEHDHIQLFYDRENMIIGIKPVVEGKEDAIKVRRISDGKAAAVSARPFFSYFNVPYNKEKTESYPVHWNVGEYLVEVRLKGKEDREENDIPF